MASGNQQLIDHLNLLDAVGIAAATPTASASSVQQAVLPSQPDRSVPAKELSGWEKRQAVADQRKKDYPLLFGAAKVFLLGVVSLFAYSMWTVYQVRNSAEYSQCLSALLLPTDEQVDTCQRETRLKLYGR